MIKRLLFVCLLMLVFMGLKAQPYGNEWINYSQNYYKIKITKNGIYHIDSATLAAAGIFSIDPHRFQIFNKGTQQYIFVKGEGDNVFNANDYIEFYAEANDGTLDSALYKNTSFIPNPYYSLVNDTAIYYLTWNLSGPANRMVTVTDTTAFSSYTPDNYFFKEEIQSFHSGYYDGETDVVGGTDARYTRSEGWFDGSVINVGGTQTYSINTAKTYTSGPSPLVTIVAIGASKNIQVLPNPDHHLKIEFQGSGGYQLFKDTLFKGYESNRFIDNTIISASALGNSITNFKFTSLADPGFTSNRTAVSYITIKYPHTFDLEGSTGFLFYLPYNGSTKSYLNISNFNASGAVHIYDLTAHNRIDVAPSGSNFKTLLPTSGSEKKCFITSDGNITNITSVQAVTPSAKFTDYSLFSADSAFIIVTHKSVMSSAITYKNYRSSITGGSHNVAFADIDELYDQFAFGIVKSPLSIRGFADYLLDTYPTPPQNLFLIGKSIHLSSCRQNATNYAKCLVPSFGNPSSDNLITAGLNGTQIEPAISTGRLAAKNNFDIDSYYDKVVTYESNPPAEWMKEVLHFGGGDNTGLQSMIKNYLNAYEVIIEDTSFGGHVTPFFKTNSLPMQINTSDSIQDIIDNGVSLMTFFGHASGTSFDQSLNDINTYNPGGHYPFMIANGCYTGDIHSTGTGTSEEYVLTPQKGMIGYLATVGLGVPDALNDFTNEFYMQLSRLNYGKSVGYEIKKTIHNIEPLALFGSQDPLVRAVCYEMTLHGDPSIIINAHKKPDYKITNNDVYFDMITIPGYVNVFVIRTNIGKATHDSITTEIQRIFPNGDTTSYSIRNASPFFKDTLVFTIPIDETRGIGLNKLKITLDSRFKVDELNENNNSTNPYVDLLIIGSGLIPVYPYEFAIIPTDTITLKASTANPFALAKNYRFEIDTTDTFNSPFLKTTIINAPGGVVTWKLNTLPYPAITFTDSTVYYWRVSPDSISPASGYVWRESSFQYINNKRGWEQAHFFQYKNDGYQLTKFNRPQRKFDFVNDVKNIICNNGIVPALPWEQVYFSVNGANAFTSAWAAPSPSFIFAVFNPASGNPMLNVPQGGGQGLFGSITGNPLYNTPEKAFEFIEGDSTSRSKMKNFILNDIPNGSYVLAYTSQHHSISTYESSVISAFGTIGGAQLNVPSSRPYILWGKKGGGIGDSKELVGSSVNSIIQLDTSITTNWNEGYIASPVIGPASSWGSFHWRQTTLDGASTKDTIFVRIIGIKANGQEITRANFPKDSMDVLDLANYVDADSFPTIRLIAFMKDDSLHTPPQMKRWQVIYAPVPEAAINPPLGYSISNDNVQEGDNITFQLPIQNISDIPFTQDSLLVTYWIEDVNRLNHPLPSKLKKKPFNPGEVIMDTINLNTATYKGSNALWVEVNPINQTRSQLEQYHFNNIIRIPFNVAADKINPLLDVTFDGVHILNNDIVSAKPNILIKLKDENQFLALNDTSDFKLFIQTPSNSVAQRIYFSTILTFIPAVLPNNSCKINYTPAYSQDGTYQLIVQAKDKSGNQSGAIDYKISFEIINKASITEVMNYPNPFSTATHFVFTLTGSEQPSNFKIQIMTITGKVVREIFQDEIGAIHVGRNITDYAWDGRDEFGDRLANGVYLYRVITKLNGEDIEKRQTDADQYFKKGWGKMYLMR